MAKVKITETILRDGHQSLIATRMTTEEMLPALEILDGVGYHAMEVWGGATFDACLRFLNEDPWERLRIIRKNVKNTKLQMLLRGQNLLGYKHYADDVVEEFVNKAISKWPVFQEFVSIISENATRRLLHKDLARMLTARCDLQWKESTAEINVKVMLDWTRHLQLVSGLHAHSLRGRFKPEDDESQEQLLF